MSFHQRFSRKESVLSRTEREKKDVLVWKHPQLSVIMWLWFFYLQHMKTRVHQDVGSSASKRNEQVQKGNEWVNFLSGSRTTEPACYYIDFSFSININMYYHNINVFFMFVKCLFISVCLSSIIFMSWYVCSVYLNKLKHIKQSWKEKTYFKIVKLYL